ncbi:aspartate/glutamate racemase family protein [Leisingera sp. XS_AS12]|uniref:maleate cis-trans isomerase family protein n=1 Tax=Leisingera sp. XS_AS12 TaxID=3241294 RepID=UPI003517218D
MSHFHCDLSDSPLPRLGVLVLENDETLEEDLRRIFPPEVARLHVSRVPSRAELNPETLQAMEATIPAAADLLPKAPRYAAVGYGCTSGAMMIGADRVRELVSEAAPTDSVTEPFTATLKALEVTGVRRLGLISPYIETVAAPLQRALEAQGIVVPHSLSFGEEQEPKVARISPQSLMDAAGAIAREGDIDGIFLSCTNLRTLDIIPTLEDTLGLPVLSSNQTLAWHMATLSGVVGQAVGPGRLWRLRP